MEPSANKIESPSRIAWTAGIVGAVLLAAVAVILAGDVAFRLRSERTIERGRIELDRYATLLATELHRFDYLPDLLQNHPVVMDVLKQPGDPKRVDDANRYLQAVNDAAGTTTLYLLDLNGKAMAASNWNEPASFVGVDLSYRPYFARSLRDGSGRFYGIGTTSGTPGYYFATTLPRGKAPLGIGVVKVNLEGLQVRPSSAIGDVIVIDEQGVIVLASRPAWQYRTMTQLAPEALASLRDARQYENVELAPIGIKTEEAFGGEGAIISLPGGKPGEERSRFLAQEKKLDGSDWKIVILSELSDVKLYQRWAQVAAALLATSIVFFVLFVLQRRRAVRLQLAGREALARANVELEHQVAQRTQALVDTNQQLRDTQDELVHSAKLAAIGQLAAGVTHELNQPLAAIRTLSENADVLIERSQIDIARGNMRDITDLVDRLSGITAQLKQFARKSSVNLQRVPISRSIRNCMQIVAHRIKKAEVAVDIEIADENLCVHADAPRLEQVLINLLSNAIDATAGIEKPAVRIAASRAGDMVLISVQDNGVGLSEEVISHLFEPFFTTKEAGSGLGLGLAISTGIINQFGGTLTASGEAQRGAIFLIKLPLYRNEPDVRDV
ncbi:ATP-binding protein [Bradyrhizobium sp. JYMT SZCCT0180]|uniref:sensor histidine kinase n=1 Tax=Bradyrhizobium sp. JYMT SZCCT0180 TaxID=2807666 RepID=UPI001BA6D55E|nr:ATP-binding protein [Bradyrhizobium sp. JYMT SZCCT0180]MBR1212303.1 sensor histidine kinase [Bradyrhizobium sp. JYMT SZCCT0180]